MQLPAALPVIALPHCSLFPGSRLPLFIFEPRYRQMLVDVVEGDRMFCVGTCFGDPEEGAEIEEFSCAGLLRACVGNDDGTLNLVLEGVQRVRFTGWREGEPYRIGEIEPVPTEASEPAELLIVGAEIKSIAHRMLLAKGMTDEQIADLWEGLGSEEAMADFVAFHLVPDVETRHPLLGMGNVVERLMLLGKLLS